MNTQSLERGIRFVSPNLSAVITPGDGVSVNHIDGVAQISWDVKCSAAPAAATPVNLEGCNADPSIAANWFVLDTVDMNGITDSLRHVAWKPCIWLRINPTLNPSARQFTGGILIR